jgi:hypothetical protein
MFTAKIKPADYNFECDFLICTLSLITLLIFTKIVTLISECLPDYFIRSNYPVNPGEK